MASDPERERMLAGFRQAQQVKERADARARRRPRLPIPSPVAAGIVAVLVVGFVVALFGIPIYQAFQMTQPVKSFCQQISAQNYSAAWGYLSSSLQRQVPETQFAQRVEQTGLIGCSTTSAAHLNDDRKTGYINMSLVFVRARGPVTRPSCWWMTAPAGVSTASRTPSCRCRKASYGLRVPYGRAAAAAAARHLAPIPTSRAENVSYRRHAVATANAESADRTIEVIAQQHDRHMGRSVWRRSQWRPSQDNGGRGSRTPPAWAD